MREEFISFYCVLYENERTNIGHFNILHLVLSIIQSYRAGRVCQSILEESIQSVHNEQNATKCEQLKIGNLKCEHFKDREKKKKEAKIQ